MNHINQPTESRLSFMLNDYQYFALVGCLLLGASTVEVIAEPVTVPNFSFEENVLADGASAQQIDSWTASGSNFAAGKINPKDAQFPGSSGTGNLPAPALGQQCASIFVGGAGVGGTLTSAPLTSIRANTTYKLTIAMGSRLEFAITPGIVHQARIAFLANGMAIPGAELSLDSNLLPDGGFADYTVSFSTGSNSHLIGQSLQASFGFVAEISGVVEFDNVRVDATRVSDPSDTGGFKMLDTVLIPSAATYGPKVSGRLKGGPSGKTARIQVSRDFGKTDPWFTLGMVTLDSAGSGEFTDVQDDRPTSFGIPTYFVRAAADP